MFSLKDSLYGFSKEKENLLGFGGYYKSLGAMAVIVVRMEVGFVYCCGGLKNGGGKRGGGGMPFLVAALVCVGVW